MAAFIGLLLNNLCFKKDKQANHIGLASTYASEAFAVKERFAT